MLSTCRVDKTEDGPLKRQARGKVDGEGVKPSGVERQSGFCLQETVLITGASRKVRSVTHE